MNKCEKCGFLHYRTDPCRKLKEPQVSKLAIASRSRTEQSDLAQRIEDSAPASSASVDANQAGGGNVPSLSRPPDAVTGKFDKKAWMREYMREYMRKRRAK